MDQECSQIQSPMITMTVTAKENPAMMMTTRITLTPAPTLVYRVTPSKTANRAVMRPTAVSIHTGPVSARAGNQIEDIELCYI